MEKTLQILNSSKKSKLGQLKHDQDKTQDYLTSADISIRNKKLIFALKSRMVKVSDNYSKQDLCRLCQKTDSQRHLIESCEKILDSSVDIRTNTEAKYEDIYSNDVNKLKQISLLYRKAIQARDVLLSEETSL